MSKGTEQPKKRPEQKVWELFGKAAAFIGAIVVGALVIEDLIGKD